MEAWWLLVFTHILLFNKVHCCIISHAQAQCQYLSLTGVPQPNHGNISSLNISHNFISSFSSKDLKNYANLIEFDAAYNNISCIEAGSFFSNLGLQTLVLESNALSTLNASNFFSPNSSVQMLNLRRNKLTLVDIAKLGNIKFLNLELNLIKTFMFSSLNIESLENLYLGGNQIEELVFPQNCQDLTNSIKELDIHNNKLKDVSFLTNCKFSSLQKLNLERNYISYLHQHAFAGLISLSTLILNANPILVISRLAFNGLDNLIHLHLNDLSKLENVTDNDFANLSELHNLGLHRSPKLANLNYKMLKHFTKLQYLDLSENNLTHVDVRIFKFLKNLKHLNLSGNDWVCDCSAMLLNRILVEALNLHSPHLVTCTFPEELRGLPLSEASVKLNCFDAPLRTPGEEVLFFISGSMATLHCRNNSNSLESDFMWLKTTNGKIEMYFDSDDQKLLPPKYRILQNGSLLIENIESRDLGLYECYNTQWGSLERGVYLKFDFEILMKTEFTSMLVGLVTSSSFLLFAILFGGIRTCCKLCSQKEKEKKSSMKETLNALRVNFQTDRLQNYTSARIERLTALRSATLEQMSAFKSAKVSQLRKYKQASVNGILHCLDRMRVHYGNQSMKIKANCQQQFDKLREGYVYQRTRFRDSRSLQLRKIRDHYQSQTLRVKGYGVHQV